MEFFFVRIKLK